MQYADALLKTIIQMNAGKDSAGATQPKRQNTVGSQIGNIEAEQPVCSRQATM